MPKVKKFDYISHRHSNFPFGIAGRDLDYDQVLSLFGADWFDNVKRHVGRSMWQVCFSATYAVKLTETFRMAWKDSGSEYPAACYTIENECMARYKFIIMCHNCQHFIQFQTLFLAKTKCRNCMRKRIIAKLSE